MREDCTHRLPVEAPGRMACTPDLSVHEGLHKALLRCWPHALPVVAPSEVVMHYRPTQPPGLACLLGVWCVHTCLKHRARGCTQQSDCQS